MSQDNYNFNGMDDNLIEICETDVKICVMNNCNDEIKTCLVGFCPKTL